MEIVYINERRQSVVERKSRVLRTENEIIEQRMKNCQGYTKSHSVISLQPKYWDQYHFESKTEDPWEELAAASPNYPNYYGNAPDQSNDSLSKL